MREESEKATGASGAVGIGNMAKAFQPAIVALDREGTIVSHRTGGWIYLPWLVDV